MTAYDSPIYIADAALYLMKTQPDLGIKNPYALDQKQLDAAVSLLKNQRSNISEYWSDYLKEVQAFKTGDSVIGTTWKIIQQTAAGEKAPGQGDPPERGRDRLVGHLDDQLEGPAPELRLRVDVLHHRAEAAVGGRAVLRRGTGQRPGLRSSPARRSARPTTSQDKAFADKIWYWTTPISQCLDGRTDTKCTDYGDWTQAWTEIKG